MATTQIDRSTTAKVQTISGTPGSDTYGNISICSTGPSFRFKYGSTWYSLTGGVFEEGTGAYSAKRSGVATSTVAGDYSFSMGPGNTVTGSYSAAFGTGHTIAAGVNFVAGSANALGASSTYNAVFGSTQTINSSSDYNLVAGYNHTVGGDHNLVFGTGNTVSVTLYSSLLGGNGNTVSGTTTGSIISGASNTVDNNYGLTIGRNNENTEDYSLVHGRYAKAIWPGARHFSGGRVDGSTTGCSQGMDGLILIAQTDGAETVIMTLDSNDGSGTNPLYCPDGHTIVARMHIVGISTGTATGIEIFEYVVVIHRVDPTFEVWARSEYTDIEGTNIGAPSLTEDVVNYKAQLSVTGVAGVVTNWVTNITDVIVVKGDYAFTGS